MGRRWEGLRCTRRGPARAATGWGLTFLAAERRVPGEREEGAQAEEQQRQEGAIAEPHFPRCAAGAGGAEAAWPGGPGPGRGGREAAGAPAPERGGAAGPGEAAAVWAGIGTGGSRTGCSSAARGTSGLGRRLGRGRAGLGKAARAAARLDPGPPPSRRRRAGRPGFKGAASPAAAGITTRGRGGRPAPGFPGGPDSGARRARGITRPEGEVV